MNENIIHYKGEVMFREPIEEPEYIPPTRDKFDENSLLEDVISKWGAYGAHADIVKFMISEIYSLREKLEALESEKESWQRMYASK